VDPRALALLERPDMRTGSQLLEDGRRAYIKRRASAPPGFFAAEARGLAALAHSSTLRVPAVLAFATNGIVIEDLGSGRPSASDWQAGGRELARMHAVPAPQFGFEADGYCGDSAQANTPDRDGAHFFAERRLLPQARRAFDADRLDGSDLRRIESLCKRLGELLPPRPPVLIHGDLWTGNLHACASGELALIDGGAVHHGWAECDLAMLILFGEPPREFFAAYENTAGIGADWRQRAPLLNLYHLLNHVNLFGGGYLSAVRSVLGHFA
jgi:fructosamine-3-kinase